jgi:hypothetical protein
VNRSAAFSGGIHIIDTNISVFAYSSIAVDGQKIYFIL